MISKPVGTVAKIIAGQSPESSTYNCAGDGLPFFQGKADFQEMYPTVRIWCTSPKRKEAEPGDILISVRAPIGAVNICNQKSIIGRGLSAIRPSSSLNGMFLYYFLKANERKIESLGTGSTFKAITQETLKKIEIPLPPLDDQKRIAHLLGKVEGMIAQRKQRLQQLDDLLKSVFLDMFGDPVRNEKGWKRDRIGRSVKFQCGYAFKSNDLVSKGTVRLAKIANVHFEKLIWDDVSFVPDHFHDDYKRFSLHEGDLLIALTRPVIKSLDVVKTATVRNCDLPCLLNQRVARFVLDESQIDKKFLLQYCYTRFFKNTVEKLCPPGLQPNISTNQIEDIPIYYPQIDLQKKFATIAEKIGGLKSRYQQSLADLESLYSALSQKAFKGELDLSRIPLPTEIAQHTEVVGSTIPEQRAPLTLFTLPAPAKSALLQSIKGRNTLLDQWLTAWLEHLGEAPFFAQPFMDAANQRLAELVEDDTPEWGVSEYGYLRSWVFEALTQGSLTQAYDDAHNRVQLKKIKP